MKRFSLLLPFIGFCFSISSLKAEEKALSREEAYYLRKDIRNAWKSAQRKNLEKNAKDMTVRVGDLEMKYSGQIFGKEPSNGRSLWISLHGGGKTTTEVNNQQWDNQKRLYQPKEGVYVCPRAPWDDWDMWCKGPIDSLYKQLIQIMVAYFNVSPNKVYIMGYSAGGDGVWRMAPRMADHWAAASMMAGHPGDVRLDNLLNTPFMIWMGANDSAYDRNRHAVTRGAQMDSLQNLYPKNYIHETHIIEGKGHWMDRQDTLALDWMKKFRRDPYPKHIIWQQEEVIEPAFFWLSAPNGKRGDRLDVSIKKNTIDIQHSDYKNFTIWLTDELVDLDKNVKVRYKGKEIFKGKLIRTRKNMEESIRTRGDLYFCYPSKIDIKL